MTRPGFHMGVSLPVERTPGVGRVAVVVVAESLGDVLRELGTVPEGNGREEVVADVVVRDLVRSGNTRFLGQRELRANS